MMSRARHKLKIQSKDELRKRNMWLKRVKQDNKVKVYEL